MRGYRIFGILLFSLLLSGVSHGYICVETFARKSPEALASKPTETFNTTDPLLNSLLKNIENKNFSGVRKNLGEIQARGKNVSRGALDHIVSKMEPLYTEMNAPLIMVRLLIVLGKYRFQMTPMQLEAWSVEFSRILKNHGAKVGWNSVSDPLLALRLMGNRVPDVLLESIHLWVLGHGMNVNANFKALSLVARHFRGEDGLKINDYFLEVIASKTVDLVENSIRRDGKIDKAEVENVITLLSALRAMGHIPSKALEESFWKIESQLETEAKLSEKLWLVDILGHVRDYFLEEAMRREMGGFFDHEMADEY